MIQNKKGTKQKKIEIHKSVVRNQEKENEIRTAAVHLSKMNEQTHIHCSSLFVVVVQVSLAILTEK